MAIACCTRAAVYSQAHKDEQEGLLLAGPGSRDRQFQTAEECRLEEFHICSQTGPGGGESHQWTCPACLTEMPARADVAGLQHTGVILEPGSSARPVALLVRRLRWPGKQGSWGWGPWMDWQTQPLSGIRFLFLRGSEPGGGSAWGESWGLSLQDTKLLISGSFCT
jgi:hypothetical protein